MMKGVAGYVLVFNLPLTSGLSAHSCSPFDRSM